MAATHNSEWLNFQYPRTALSTGTGSGSYTASLQFTPTVDCLVDALAWYRDDTTGVTTPTHLGVWRVSNTTLLAECPTIGDDGTVGWQDCLLSTPLALFAGVNYKLAVYWSAGHTDNVDHPGDQAPAGGGLQWVQPRGGYRNTDSTWAYPNYNDSSANAYTRGIDAHVMAGGLTAPNTTSTDTSLASWLLSTNDNQHKTDGLPWLTKAAVDAVQGDVTTALTNLDNVTAGEVTTYGLRGRSIGAAVSWLLANVNTAIDLATKLHNLLSANGTGGDTYDYHGALEDVRQKVYDIEARQLAQLQPPAPASWVSQGTQAFDTDLAWAQEADVYTITYTSTGSAVVNSYPSGVDVAYRVLWWAVWDGERMRDRRFADGVLPVLYDGGARMPGIVLHSTAGASGTVEAWTLS